MAARSCEECQAKWFDDSTDPETGKWRFSTKTLMRGGQPLDRPETFKPPCRQKTATGATCPKGTPETAHENQLSEKNKRAVEFYKQTQACCGGNLTDAERQDGVLLRNLALIDEFYQAKAQTGGIGRR